jgi:ligand-binding sensor domain-containing protein/serine phosphatase RsbU (regulator of sigma subunit)
MKGDAKRVPMELPDARLYGVVRSADGKPAFDARVMLWRGEEMVYSAQTVQKGNYSVVLRSGRPYALYVAWNDQGATKEGITFRQREQRQLDFTLKPAVSIEGKTISVAGDMPLANLRVQALLFGGLTPEQQKVISEAQTDEKGIYQFVNLPPLRYHVRCQFAEKFTYFRSPSPPAPLLQGERGAGRGEGEQDASPVIVKRGAMTKGIDIALDPSDVAGRYQLAVLLARREKYQPAFELCQKILADKPDHEDAAHLAAQLMAALDQKQIQARLKKLTVSSPLPQGKSAPSPLVGEGRGEGGEGELVDSLKYDYLVGLSQSLLKDQKNLRAYVTKTQKALEKGYAEPDPTDVVRQALQTLDNTTQPHREQWRVFHTQDGLPNEVAWSMMQDSHGYLWVGTTVGVARFDGVHFEQPFDNASLQDKMVQKLLEDDEGSLWFGTRDGKVYRFDGERLEQPLKDVLEKEETIGPVYPIASPLPFTKGQGATLWFGTSKGRVLRYRHLPPSPSGRGAGGEGGQIDAFSQEHGLPGAPINALFEDRKGTLWVGTSGKGVYRYDGERPALRDAALRHFTNPFGEQPPQYINAIFEDNSGTLWFGGYDGLGKYDGSTYTRFTQENRHPKGGRWTMEQDTNGHVWFANSNGAARYDGKTFIIYTKEDGLPDNRFLRVTKDLRGNLWFSATISDHIAWYDGKGIRQLEEKSPVGGVLSLYADREGNMWFGSNVNLGLAALDRESVTNFTLSEGLPANNVSTLLEDTKGNIWIGTGGGYLATGEEGGGLTKFDGEGFQTWTTNEGLLNNTIIRLFEDSQGVLWIGTETGLSRYDGRRFTHFTKKDGLSGPVYAIVEDKDGVLWVGTGAWDIEGGLYRYSPTETPPFTRVNKEEIYEVSALHVDVAGNLWIAGWWGTDLFRYDGRTFTRFSTQDGLPSVRIMSISKDAQGRLWFGTAQGVSIYDGTKFINPPELSQALVHELVTDRHGNVWLATESGVVKLKLKAEIPPAPFSKGGVKSSLLEGALINALTTANGLSHNLVMSVIEDKNGRLWFGAVEGLTRHIPNPVPPLVHIERVIYADQTRKLPKRVEIPATAKRVEIHYKAIDFQTRPGQMQYLVKLEGRDKDWTLTKENSVALLNLKPGDYTFQVKAIDRDLNYSKPASASIVINAPPFYQTGIFLVALSIIGGASLIGIAILAIQRWRLSNAEKLRFQQELEDAHRMQLRLLPESAPAVKDFDIAGFSRPAREVGGDFFDYLSVADGKIGIALADVSGKGLKGAMNAVLVNGMLHEVAKNEAYCGKILSALNADLYPRVEKQMFTALGLAIFDQDGKTLQWANAAQPYPMVKRGEEVFEFKSDGALPLGMMRNVEYSDWELELQAGDVVIFYTDGIIEAANEAGEMYETERLEQVVTHIDSTMSAGKIIETILQDVAGFVGTAEQYDDMTAIIVKKL